MLAWAPVNGHQMSSNWNSTHVYRHRSEDLVIRLQAFLPPSIPPTFIIISYPHYITAPLAYSETHEYGHLHGPVTSILYWFSSATLFKHKIISYNECQY